MVGTARPGRARAPVLGALVIPPPRLAWDAVSARQTSWQNCFTNPWLPWYTLLRGVSSAQTCDCLSPGIAAAWHEIGSEVTRIREGIARRVVWWGLSRVTRSSTVSA